MKFRIYRYNPDTDIAPYMQDYDLSLEAGDAMLLDALMQLRNKTIVSVSANPAAKACADRMR